MATIIKMLLGAKIEKIFYLLYLCRHILKKIVMISVENLQVEFGGFTLFDDVSFVINKKDRIALVGKNGAGKSTLLKVMAGVEKPEDGTLQLNGETITLSSPQVALSSGIACVYQELRLIPDLTVMENIFLAATAEGLACAFRIPINGESAHVKALVGAPEDYELTCFLTVGYPAPDAFIPTQKVIDVRERIHSGKW